MGESSAARSKDVEGIITGVRGGSAGFAFCGLRQRLSTSPYPPLDSRSDILQGLKKYQNSWELQRRMELTSVCRVFFVFKFRGYRLGSLNYPPFGIIFCNDV